MSSPAALAAPRRWSGGRSIRALVRDVVLGALLLAILVAVVWVRLAPDVSGRITDGGAVIDGADAPALFGREAVLAVLLAAAGALLAVAVVLRHRATLLPAALLLAAAGLLGAVLAWRLGVVLGPDAPADPRTLAVGTRFPVPLALDAPGVLCLWAITSLAVVLLLNAWLAPRPTLTTTTT